MNSHVNSIRMTINQDGFIKAMKNGFESPISVIRELAQNARRAGATRIDFLFDKDSNSFTILDNGNGIQDFGKLISPYKSEWSENIKNETPYGVGFLSCILAADFLMVKSNGKLIEASCEDIRSFKDIPVLDATNDGFTTITLTGEAISQLFSADFNDIFRGFEIPVFVNCVEIPRAHAIDSKAFESMSAGNLYLYPHQIYDNKASPEYYSLKYSSQTALYYQGFLIGWIAGTYPNDKTCNVLHIDIERFDAIAPDRHCLVDAVNAHKVISQEINDFIRQDILLKHKEYGDEILLNSHRTLKDFQLTHLYNDLDRVPRYFFSLYQVYPVNPDNRHVNNNEPIVPSEHPSRADIESGNLNIFETAFKEDDYDNEDYSTLMYCWITDSLVLNTNLHQDHWLHQYLRQPEEVTFTIVGAMNAMTPQNSNGLNHHVTLCEKIVLSGPAGDRDCDYSALLSDEIYIPPNDNNDDVVLQSATFVDEYDSVDEGYYQMSCEQFRTWLSNARNENDPLALFKNIVEKQILNYDGLNKFPPLHGQRFTVDFTPDGKMLIANA